MVIETLLDRILAIEFLGEDPPQCRLHVHSDNNCIPSKSQFLPLVAPMPSRPFAASLSSLVD